jgi:acyl-CoA dehydrogenase
MLLTMRALTQAARAICYATAMALDRAERGTDARRAQGGARARLAAHAGRQGVLHRYRQRGHLARRAGAWRHGLYRGDRRGAAVSRCADRPIYEGTNGIQAIDLVTRKLPLPAARDAVAAYQGTARHRRCGQAPATIRRFGWTACGSSEALESLARATSWMLAHVDKDTDAALAGASPYLRLFGITTGGCLLAQQALAALRLGEDGAARIALARFFAENFAVQAAGSNAPWSKARPA